MTMIQAKPHPIMQAHGKTFAAVLVAALAVGLLLTGCATGSGSPTRHSARDSGRQTEEEAAIPEPNVKTLYALARIFKAQGKEDQSEMVLQRLIAEYPGFVPAYSDLAELYMGIDRIEEAMETLNAGLELSPEDPVLLNNLGICKLYVGDHEAALARFRQASAQMPRESRYRGNIALALALQERYEDAEAVYSQIVSDEQAQQNIETIRAVHGRTDGLRSLLRSPEPSRPEAGEHQIIPMEPVSEELEVPQVEAEPLDAPQRDEQETPIE